MASRGTPRFEWVSNRIWRFGERCECQRPARACGTSGPRLMASTEKKPIEPALSCLLELCGGFWAGRPLAFVRT